MDNKLLLFAANRTSEIETTSEDEMLTHEKFVELCKKVFWEQYDKYPPIHTKFFDTPITDKIDVIGVEVDQPIERYGKCYTDWRGFYGSVKEETD